MKIIYLFIYFFVDGYFVSMYNHVHHVHNALGSQNTASGPLGLELQRFTSYHVDAAPLQSSH